MVVGWEHGGGADGGREKVEEGEGGSGGVELVKDMREAGKRGEGRGS